MTAGKDILRREIHQISRGSAKHMLNFAQAAQERLIPDALEVSE